MKNARGLFDLQGRVAIITGGAGMLGVRHAEAIASAGGVPVLADIRGKLAREKAREIAGKYQCSAMGVQADVTCEESIKKLLRTVVNACGKVDILINNAAVDAKVKPGKNFLGRLEDFPLLVWERDIAVGLTGAFLCAKIIGSRMAAQKKGVILNIASDLSVIAPDQRIYRKNNLPEHKQQVKPVSYPVVKSALLGLTRYLATYWADKGVRVNALSPGGVFLNQPKEFVRKLTSLIPLGRMACGDEYKGAVIFLCSDASSYMTGANVVIDGGRTCW